MAGRARIQQSMKPKTPKVSKTTAAERFEETTKNPVLDRARVAKNVAPLKPENERERKLQHRYLRNPQRMDYEGIDAPMGTATRMDMPSVEVKKPQKGRAARSQEPATFAELFGAAEDVPLSEREARYAAAIGLPEDIVEAIRNDRTHDRKGRKAFWSESGRPSAIVPIEIVSDRFGSDGEHIGVLVHFEGEDREQIVVPEEVYATEQDAETNQPMMVRPRYVTDTAAQDIPEPTQEPTEGFGVTRRPEMIEAQREAEERFEAEREEQRAKMRERREAQRRPETEADAFAMGMRDFIQGTPRRAPLVFWEGVPADPDHLEEMGRANDLAAAWLRGWDEGNLSSPIDKPDDVATISKQQGEVEPDDDVQPTERPRAEGEAPRVPPDVPSEVLPRAEEGRDTGRGARPSGTVMPEDGNGERRVPAGVVGLRDQNGDPRPGRVKTEDPLHQLQPQNVYDRGKDFILDRATLGFDAPAGQRFDANLEAIRIVKQLEAEDRRATPEEQAKLARYSGFGDSAFNQAFPANPYMRRDNAWVEREEALRELIGEDEYRSIERSRINAFYTTPTVIDAMWNGMDRLGAGKLPSPRVLEPSAGSGRFLGLQPVEMAARSQRTAVELDELTGQVVKHLYPNTSVHIMGFQEAPIHNDSIDVAVSNVPFGDVPVADRAFRKGGRALLARQIHNYFFGKTLDKLRPGGVLAFVTSHGTLDAPSNTRMREVLAESADLLGAIRLPRGAFPDTDVVTDIIFMRKRVPGDPPSDAAWTNSTKQTIKVDGWPYEREVDVNQYFIDHPEMVLGTHATSGSMYRGNEYTVEPREGVDLTEALNDAVRRLPADVVTEEPENTPRSVPILGAAIGKREGAYFIGEDGSLMAVRNGITEPAGLTPKEAERVTAMLGIRDAARHVLDLQIKNASQEEVKDAQRALNEAYDAFHKQHGPLNDKANATLMREDPDASFLRSLERLDKKGKVPKGAKVDDVKSAIFTQRVLRGEITPEVKSTVDAMAVALHQTGRLDFDRIAELTGKTPDEVQRELAAEQRIFKNPVGDWEESDKYLTGYVREKLATARAAARVNPAFNANVEALKRVQPEDIPPSQIKAQLGAPWVPASDVDDFLRDLVDADRYNWRRSADPIFSYNPTNGSWNMERKVQVSESKNFVEWGTAKIGATGIIDKMLNGKPVEVTMPDPSGGDKRVRDEQGTVEAQEKARAIQAEFERWLWDDPERAERLSRYYNDTFNNLRPRVFDGSHLQFPGMSERWAQQLHEHQKDAIWRVLQDRTALLAHEVGFGKTAVMVAAGMELRRLGLSRKNLYVVPKATHAQFRDQFQDLYPGAKVLFPEQEDFTPQRRGVFMNRIATGDWDAVIMADSQFTKIPLKPQTEKKFLMEEMDELRAAMLSVQNTSGKDSKSHKEMQKSLQRLEARLATVQQAIEERRDVQGLDFEDMGIDQLFVDEADLFKNLRFTTQMGRIKGLPNSESQRAFDMYMKTKWLQKEGGAGGVVFATGTPVSNTIAELWTNMRYLQHPMLEERGLEHFDSWAKTFGGTTEGLEQTPTGNFRVTQRFAKFNNLPELSNLWQQTADIRVASEVPAMLARQPQIVGGKRQTVVIPRTPELADYMQSLSKRAENLGNVDPTEDNMLKISNDARKASLDMRLVAPNARENPQGKAAIAAQNIADIYNETKTERGTQIVFLDLGIPKAKDKVSEDTSLEDSWQDDAVTTDEANTLTSVYADIRGRLVEKGVKPDEIAFIHDAKTNDARLRLFEAMNNGDIRVLIGSTGKMGAGVNVQKRAAALHHMDVPWKPRDIEQREGRIIRQGNEAYGPVLDDEGHVVNPGKGVQIFNYVTEGSFDGYMWQAVEAKAKAIKSLVKRNVVAREMEDIDDLVLSASEAKALAAGNPDVMRQVQLKNDLQRLQMSAGAHRDAQVRARQALASAPARIKSLESLVTDLTRDQARAKAPGEFTMTVGSTPITKRADAGEALKATLEKLPASSEATDAKQIASYRGFAVLGRNTYDGFIITATSLETGREYAIPKIATDDLTAAGVVQRIDNRINGIPNTLAEAQSDLERAKANISTYQEQAEKPYEKQAEIDAVLQELAAVEKRLQERESKEAVPA